VNRYKKPFKPKLTPLTIPLALWIIEGIMSVISTTQTIYLLTMALAVTEKGKIKQNSKSSWHISRKAETTVALGSLTFEISNSRYLLIASTYTISGLYERVGLLYRRLIIANFWIYSIKKSTMAWGKDILREEMRAKLRLKSQFLPRCTKFWFYLIYSLLLLSNSLFYCDIIHL